MARDDQTTGAGGGGAARPRARCIVLAPAEQGLRADLATVLGQRGAVVEVVFDALSAATQLGAWHILARQEREQRALQGNAEPPSHDRIGTILLLVQPEELLESAALSESVTAYFPEVTIATFGENGSSRITVRRAGRSPEAAKNEAPSGDGLPRVVVMPRPMPKAASFGPSLRLVKNLDDAAPDAHAESESHGDDDDGSDVDDGALVSAEELAMLLARDGDDVFGGPNQGGGAT